MNSTPNSITDNVAEWNEFNIECEITFNEVYSDFIRKSSVDVLKYNGKNMLRSRWRDVIINSNDQKLLKHICEHKKSIQSGTLSRQIDDPFELLGYTDKSSVQKSIMKHAKMLSVFGNYAYSCSCGSGKTLAGLYLMHYLQCKTMIISSRNAVNDQWLSVINTLYPGLTVKTKNGVFVNGIKLKKKDAINANVDVWIYSPCWLGPKIMEVNIKPDLIIYDEVHSLLSPMFIRVLLYPLMKVNEGVMNELPYMIALSATYPPINSKGYMSIVKLFGKVFRSESTITNIPVYVWDYYDHYQRTIYKGKSNERLITNPEEARGYFDKSYEGMNEYETIDYFIGQITYAIDHANTVQMNDANNHINNSTSNSTANDATNSTNNHANNHANNIQMNSTVNGEMNSRINDTSNPTINSLDSLQQICSEIDPTNNNFKGIIMTHHINASVYAALMAHKVWNCNVVLIRQIDESSILLEHDKDMNFEFNSSIDLNSLTSNNIGIKCEYADVIHSCSVIVGTFARLKEGFSVQNITWGICTKFIWSQISRIQMLGRIRRNSDNDELNKKKRIMLVCSGSRPNNVNTPFAKPPYKFTYDLDEESRMFKLENYVRL